MEYIYIEDKLVSVALFEEMFHCNYEACKGACCVEGEEGAPVTADEIVALQDALPKFAHLLNDAGKKVIEKKGVYVKKSGGVYKTPLVKGRSCAFAVFENGKALCGIEKAQKDGLIDVQKPVSCHLYPLRVCERNGVELLEYDRWEICSPACKLGAAMKLPVFRFLKEAIERRYGEAFYVALESVFQSLAKK